MPCKNFLGGGADRTNEKCDRNKMFNVVRTKNLLKSIVRQFFDRKMFDYRFYVFFYQLFNTYVASQVPMLMFTGVVLKHSFHGVNF